MKGTIILDVADQRPPTDERECAEAVNSQGSSCKKCQVKCYRRGWDKQAVTRDNVKRVAKNWKQRNDNEKE